MDTEDAIRIPDFILWLGRNLIHPVSRKAWDWMNTEYPALDHWMLGSGEQAESVLNRMEKAGFDVMPV